MNVNPIIDTLMTFEEAIASTHAPAKIIDSLQLIEVRYWSFDERLHQGQLVVHRARATIIPERAVLLRRYSWSVVLETTTFPSVSEACRRCILFPMRCAKPT